MFKEVRLTNCSLSAIVDAADLDAVVTAGPWFPHVTPETVYVQRTVRDPNTGKRSTEKLGHFLLGLRDTKMTVHYLNGNGCHCWRSNLRVVAKPARPKRSFGLQRRGDKRNYNL